MSVSITLMDMEKERIYKEIIIIQFNSIIYYLCAESTATRPITDAAQCRYK
jgi:hypothetical protein